MILMPASWPSILLWFTALFVFCGEASSHWTPTSRSLAKGDSGLLISRRYSAGSAPTPRPPAIPVAKGPSPLRWRLRPPHPFGPQPPTLLLSLGLGALLIAVWVTFSAQIRRLCCSPIPPPIAVRHNAAVKSPVLFSPVVSHSSHPSAPRTSSARRNARDDSAEPPDEAEEGALRLLRSCGMEPIPGSLELLTAGYCNRVHRADVRTTTGAAPTPVVVKQFSGIALARRTACAAATDRLAGAHGLAAPLLGATDTGVVHAFVPGRPLEEADMRSGDPRLLRAVADVVGRLHALPLNAVLESDPRPPKPMVWTSIDVMLDLVGTDGHRRGSSDALQTEDALRRACDAERDAAARIGFPLAVCHGDCKPSNVLLTPSDGRVQLIDFEIAGPNYRGFDLCKLLRNDLTPVAEESMRTFVELYSSPNAARSAVRDLVAECRWMERLTWLEAAVFFHAVRADPSEAITAAERARAQRLADHRWQRYLSCAAEDPITSQRPRPDRT
jgi:ethanolamine kinase